MKHFGPGLEVYSAGTAAEGKVNPYAIKAMAEIGIDISQQKSESVTDYLNTSFDYVITVCDGAKEACPVFTGKVKHRLHMGFEDPAAATGTEEQVMPLYRKVRDQIRDEFNQWFNNIKTG